MAPSRPNDHEHDPAHDRSHEHGRVDVRAHLRAHGLRYSRPRAAIVSFFREEDRHVSAEDLHHELHARGTALSLSTVYLNLNVLSEAGVVREFQGKQGQKLYDSNVSPHYHLIDKDTGEVVDVPAPTVDGVPLGTFLKRTVEAATGWQLEEPKVQLRGRAPSDDDVGDAADAAD
ncbi:MAG: Fur family transcriptional regulator [Trueperaceae bacterium]|nr:Fur family transcriptional regulator [Trueperaceae bacterium]